MRSRQKLLLFLTFCVQISSIESGFVASCKNVHKDLMAAMQKSFTKPIITCALIVGTMSGLASYVWAKYKKPLQDKSATIYSAVEKLIPFMAPALLGAACRKMLLPSNTMMCEMYKIALVNKIAAIFALAFCPASLIGSCVGYKAGIAGS